jgi:hypothetical protein
MFCHYAECCFLFIVVPKFIMCCIVIMLSVIMLSVIILSVIMLVVVGPYKYADCNDTKCCNAQYSHQRLFTHNLPFTF